jgi:hypothetical protein
VGHIDETNGHLVQPQDSKRRKPMNRHRAGSPAAVLVLVLALAACQGTGAGSATPAASRPGAPAQSARPAVRTLTAGCTHATPCLNITAGTYQLPLGTLLPGMELTLPAGWSSNGTIPTELNLVPPGQPDVFLNFWLDMLAVKSTGPGHGTTILNNVGTTPGALITWLTHDPDFRIVSRPAPATVGQDIKMTSLVVGVSRSANYGDPDCPANPRCADLFTNRQWPPGGYGIGGDEEVRLYLGTIKINGNPRTFFVDLDAADHADLLRLEKAVKPILGSVRLPSGVVAADPRL